MKKFISTISFLIVNLIILGAVLVLISKVTARTYQIAKDFVTNSAKSTSDRALREVKITIPNGATTKDIAKILKDNELIGSPEIFSLKVRFSEYDGTFKKGDYSLNTAMTESQIMEILKEGSKAQSDITFTIPEGYSTLKIANKLEQEGIIKANDFISSVNNGKYDYKFVNYIPERSSKLEGYLFPDTYFFREGVEPEEIVSKLLKRFNDIYIDNYNEVAKERSQTMDEVIIIASIIEKEAKLEEERPKIAGVIYNRLRENMPLQMDSTVNYAFELKDGLNSGRNEDKVSLQDIKIRSPYNTYENTGIPIGPICNPGESAIKAALYPEVHDYLYFVLKDPETGEHEFTTTLEEHNAAKAKYRN